mmetsp:Transcript_64342/g.199242  ORF Transcript_64342/g.199242 Transcript_64342/m.199242 type:complete len:202 (-) Transcript_64342:589-1194(-)
MNLHARRRELRQTPVQRCCVPVHSVIAVHPVRLDPVWPAVADADPAKQVPAASDVVVEGDDEAERQHDVEECPQGLRVHHVHQVGHHTVQPHKAEEPDRAEDAHETDALGDAQDSHDRRRGEQQEEPVRQQDRKVKRGPSPQVVARDFAGLQHDHSIAMEAGEQGHWHVQRPKNYGQPRHCMEKVELLVLLLRLAKDTVVE